MSKAFHRSNYVCFTVSVEGTIYVHSEYREPDVSKLNSWSTITKPTQLKISKPDIQVHFEKNIAHKLTKNNKN